METDEQEKCRTRSCCCGYKTSFSVLTLGTLIAIASNFLPKLYKDTVKKQLILINGSEAYQNWYSPPTPVYMTYYIFNYTNAQEIYDNEVNPVKPNVTQVGPFVYREIRMNSVLDYNEHNITYIQNYSYVFEPSKSCATCLENATVYIPSISAMSVLKEIHDKALDLSWWKQIPVNVLLNAEAYLFVKVTAHEALWGYEDNLLKALKGLTPILKAFGFKLPSITRIALQLNGTEGADQMGNVTLLTGKDNIDDVQRIVKWRGLDTAPYWLTKYGRMINGTDGTRTKPFLNRDYKFYVFVTQLCRSLLFTYEKDVRFKGIDMYRYSTTAELFANASVNPDNEAFCSSKTQCWGSGLLCISKCQEGGPPIFMSAPHFYNGDPKFSERINGLKPNKTLHGTIADVEPITGITMNAKKRLQINVMAQKSWVTISKSFQYDVNFLPILIIEEGATVDDATAAKFKNMVMLPRMFMTGKSPYGIMAFGILLVVMAVILLLVLTKNRYTSYGSDTVSVKRSISTEKDVKDELEVTIHKVDSKATIINNPYIYS